MSSNKLTKDEYILRCLSKVRKKHEEFYVVSRIIHRLNNPDIEFICQQLVRLENGKRALTDMYFPQFELHLEIDERHHEKLENEINDRERSRSIIDRTNHRIVRIKMPTKNNNRTLEDVNNDVNDFISNLQKKAEKKQFIPWDYENRYSPKRHIEKEYIDLNSNAVFRTHKDVLQCFGYEGGHHQRGAWRIPNAPEPTIIWFPKLYENGIWKNSLSEDGKVIIEKSDINPERKNYSEKRVVFAHATDELGKTLYRYLGVFDKGHEDENNIKDGVKFTRISERYDLPSLKK